MKYKKSIQVLHHQIKGTFRKKKRGEARTLPPPLMRERNPTNVCVAIWWIFAISRAAVSEASEAEVSCRASSYRGPGFEKMVETMCEEDQTCANIYGLVDGRTDPRTSRIFRKIFGSLFPERWTNDTHRISDLVETSMCNRSVEEGTARLMLQILLTANAVISVGCGPNEILRYDPAAGELRCTCIPGRNCVLGGPDWQAFGALFALILLTFTILILLAFYVISRGRNPAPEQGGRNPTPPAAAHPPNFRQNQPNYRGVGSSVHQRR